MLQFYVSGYAWSIMVLTTNLGWLVMLELAFVAVLADFTRCVEVETVAVWKQVSI